jgi:hypothetical protein
MLYTDYYMKIIKYSIVVLIFLVLNAELFAQVHVTTRGTYTFRKAGVHRGNQVRTVFSNYGVIAQPGDQGPQGAWKYDPDGYVGDVSPLIGVRLPIKDYNGDGVNDTLVEVVITPVSRPGGGSSGPGGKAWGMEPIPGFADPNLSQTGEGVAMSHQPETWPSQWPDFPTWSYTGQPLTINGKTIIPAVDWNGYFGRAQFSADQESYWWMDDNNDEKMYRTYGFLCDSTDTLRRGQGLQVVCRGLQWSNFLAQNVIFWLYNIKNDGTSIYDQTVFSVLVGTYVGIKGDEYNDDASFFNVRDAITYTWDYEPGMGGKGYIRPEANPDWQPNPFAVGYIGYAFLESPGNPFDGIDNDGDNANFSQAAPFFTEADFQPRTINAGDKLILIDKNTYARSSFTMPNDTITVYSMGVPFFLQPGVTKLVEGNMDPATKLVNPNAYDGIDNNLNGLIDENYTIHFRQFKISPQNVVLIDTLNPVQYKNYITGQGMTDPMIDERRDDGIDNNHNWNILVDDVGLDGKAGTHDFGEGDGKPTSGFQPDPITGKLVDTGEPGEPDIDKTDVNESDQLGLTSFQYFVPAGAITMSNNNNMWSRMKPGFYDVPSSIVHNVVTHGEDGDFIYGSGYFPLLPGLTERFSLALCYGDDLPGVIKTKRVAQLIYNANYNFPRPPDKPTLTVVPGDHQVTLYWDKIAEISVDPTTKEQDFEGYKIYKGTDPDFTDALQISDGTGQKVFWKPLVQFDKIDGIQGYFQSSTNLYDLTNGAPYYLGSETGIKNSYIDKDVTNGRTYYYAVVAYDRGKTESDIFPSENTHFISKDATGRISTDINTAYVIPNAPVIGYVPPKSGVVADRISGISNVSPYFEVIDPINVLNTSYTVDFLDSLISGVSFAYAYNVTNNSTQQVVLKKAPMLPSNGNVFNGTRLSIDTTFQNINEITINSSLSGWNHTDSHNLRFIASVFGPGSHYEGIRQPNTYKIVFSDAYTDTSNTLSGVFGSPGYPVLPVNFRVYNVTDSLNPKRIQFIYSESGTFRRDTLSNLDQLSLGNDDGSKMTWKIVILGDSASNIPKGGDTLTLTFNKPITSMDKFSFTTTKPGYDINSAKLQMDRIRVVPNPYVVTNVFEPPLPLNIRGRGDRVIDFIHLPPNCTINIYTSSGNHVRTLQQMGGLDDGSISWDVKTKEGLDCAYGVYFYIVEAQGISDKKFGKLAIIK